MMSFIPTSIICLSAAMDACKATIDFSLPTNNGVTTEGKITTSLNGKRGKFSVLGLDIFSFI